MEQDLEGRTAIPDRDEFVELGLLERAASDVDDREALLRFLLTRGASLDDLRRSRDIGRMVGESFDRTVRPGPRLTRREVGWRTGLDDDVLVRLRQASGLPDPGPDAPHYTEADVLAARAFERLALLFGEGVAMQLMRVIGAALGDIAETAVGAYMANLAAPLRAIGIPGTAGAADDLATARGFAEVVTALPDLGRALDTQLRHHIETALHQFAFAHRGELVPDAVTVSIGIVELVDPRSWIRSTEPVELGAALSQFVALATDVVAARGARLVKVIGEAVLFAASEAATACDIALEIVESGAASGRLPAVRGAVACGEVVVVDGDYHGSVVSLVKRMLDVAEPRGVVVTAGVAQATRASHTFRSCGAHALHGFDAAIEVLTVDRSRFAAREIA